MAFKLIEEETVQRPNKGTLMERATETLSRAPAVGFKEIGATLAGLPGDLFNLLNTMAAKPIAKQLGQKPVEYEETYLGKALPTSATLREGIERDVPFTKARNKGEEFFGDFVSDALSLALPVKGKIPFKNTLTKSIGISLGSNALGKAVEDFTGSKEKGSKVKLGSMLGLSLLSKPTARKAIKELYSEAEKAIPPGAVTDAMQLEKEVAKFQNKILAGRPVSALSPSEKFVYDEGKKILSSIDENGDIGINTLWALKRALNENLQSLFHTLPSQGSRTSAKNLGKVYSSFLRKPLETYGKQNPNFLNAFKSAEEGYGTLASSEIVSNFIKNHVHPSLANPMLLKLFGRSVGKAAVPYEALKIGYRAFKSPTIRKHYGKVIQSALKEDAVAMNRELAKMDKEIKNQEKKSKLKFKLLD